MLNLEDLKVPEIIEGVTALIVAPVILPIAAAIKQPGVQTAIKEGIALSERCKEAIAEAKETIENLAAEVDTELIAQKQAQCNPSTPQPYVADQQFDLAGTLVNSISEANSEIKRMTEGWLDMRLIVPVGLGTLAIRQLLVKGLDIDEIPWYTLAWYAFDSFSKLNAGSEISGDASSD